MKDLKLLFSISKSFIGDIWYILFFVFLFSLSISFFTILQPLLFASMVNALTPSFDFTNLFNVPQIESVDELKILDLNNIGEKFFLFFSNNVFEDQPTTIEFLYFIIPLFLVVVFFIAILNFFSKSFVHYANAKLVFSMRKKLISKLIDLDFRYYKIFSSGEIISRIIQDTRQVSLQILPIYFTFFINSILLIFYLILLINTNLKITIISVLILFSQFLAIYLLRNYIKKLYLNFVNSSANVLSNLTEVFSAIKIIKIFQNKEYHQQKTEQLMNKEKKYEFLSSSLNDGVEQVTVILTAVTTVTIIWLLFKEINGGTMSIEGALMYVVIGRMMITPTLRFINLYTRILIVSSTNKKIEYYQNLPNQIFDGKTENINFEKYIKIKNVKFSYNDKDYFNFDDLIISKGDKIGFIGINGSGKTTLIDLIIRLIYPKSGEITLDDININEFKIKSFHSLFGVVAQDPYLFNDTIKNNIVFGRQNITENQINKSLILSNSISLIDNKLLGLDYIIGENGANLSGGEKQKIAISRALLTDPQIIIFDEAMSSVDSQNTKFINENFDKIFKNKTMIVIGHSLTSLLMCNKFVKINQGKIDSIESSNDESEKKKIISQMLNK